jgi:hypothetical protein
LVYPHSCIHACMLVPMRGDLGVSILDGGGLECSMSWWSRTLGLRLSMLILCHGTACI